MLRVAVGRLPQRAPTNRFAVSLTTAPLEGDNVITRRHRCHLARGDLVSRVADRHLRPEAVSPSGHRLDEHGRPPVVAELHPQLANMPVDDVALNFELTTPDARQQLLTAQHLSGVRREKVEERLLDRGELELLAPNTDLLLHEVDLE